MRLVSALANTVMLGCWQLISADRKAVPFSCIYPFYLPRHRNPQLIDNVQDAVCHGNRALVLYIF